MDVKVFTEDGALELAEKLLQNDKDIKEELEQKGYATESFVTEKIAQAQLEDKEVDLSGYAKTEDLDDYATKEHSHNEYLTEHQDLSDYALKSQIPSIDGLVSEERLTEALSPYAKTSDIPDEYDDTVLSNRITTVESDYLKSSDKTELTQAIATAKSETIETILGEAVDADFDTLQEVADWIQADTTASAELVVRVTDVESDITNIQNDYLKAVDKTELLSSISTNATAISKNTTDITKNTTAIEENAEAIADNTTAIAVERARIDAFTALPEGSTTGDAALEDIKIKVDGTTADTAGNAVREQINTLDDKIDEEVGKLSSEIEELDKKIEGNVGKTIVLDVVNGSYYGTWDGNVYADTDNNFSRTEKVEIPADTFYLSTTAIQGDTTKYNLFWWDSNNRFLGFNQQLGNTIEKMANAKYVAFNYATVSNVPNVTIATKSANAKWSGKKWVAVGDSLTEINQRTTMHYHDYIANETGITVINKGVSGTGYASQQENGNAFYQRILGVPSDADIVTIFGSFNDGGYAVGNIADTGTSTVYGAINKTIDNLYTVIPTVKLGIISPTPWNSYNSYDGVGKEYAESYVNALKEICEKRSIPFLDLYHCSNLRPWDATFRQLAYSKDDGSGVHPDEKGHELIAGRIKVFLESLM